MLKSCLNSDISLDLKAAAWAVPLKADSQSYFPSSTSSTLIDNNPAIIMEKPPMSNA